MTPITPVSFNEESKGFISERPLIKRNRLVSFNEESKVVPLDGVPVAQQLVSFNEESKDIAQQRKTIAFEGLYPLMRNRK